MIVELDSAVNRTFPTSPLNLPRPTLGSGRRVTTSAEQSCVELDIPLSVPFSPRLPSLSPFLLFSFPPLSRQQAFRCLVKATLRSRLHVVPSPNVILHWYSHCQSLPCTSTNFSHLRVGLGGKSPSLGRARGSSEIIAFSPYTSRSLSPPCELFDPGPPPLFSAHNSAGILKGMLYHSSLSLHLPL